MKKSLVFTLALYVFASCSPKETCNFSTLEEAVDCSCQLLVEKENAKNDPESLEQIKAKSKKMDESFEEALDKGTFTEDEFIEKLMLDCPSYSTEEHAHN